MKKSLIAVLLLSLLLVIGIVVVLIDGDKTESEIASGPDAGPAFNDIQPGGERGFPSAGELERLLNEEGGPTARARYEAYRVYARYPDFSRPLTPEMKDLTDPWRVKTAALPVIAEPRLRTEKLFRKALSALRNLGKSDDEIKVELMQGAADAPRYSFDLNRHTITAGDELRAELRVRDTAGAPQDVTITDATLKSDFRMGSISLGQIDYARERPGLYAFTWKAPSEDKKYWGSLSLVVRARIPGIDEEVEVQQSFFSSPKAPARFTGAFSERLEGGSLVIDAGIEVRRDCRYALQANLFNADTGEPTHWVSSDRVLTAGTHTVSFTFYGKIFRDGGHEGRFELRHLRGTCENLPFPASWLGDPKRLKDIEKAEARNEPPMLYIPFTTMTHTTDFYRLDQFSDREWTSAHKSRRMDRLRNLAEL